MLDGRNWFAPLPESRRRTLSGAVRRGVAIELDGRQLIDFSSNDYLGLASDGRLIAAATAAMQEYGFGAAASRLIAGDQPQLHALESELAAWKGFEAARAVGSGMLLNLGLLQALADRHTQIFCDRLVHASLIDGARLSGGTLHRYAHNDLHALDALLHRHPGERRIIVTDGLFSMDGDVADIAGLLRLAEAHDALLIVDDAHGTGIAGPEWRGFVAAAGCAGHPRLIEVGTFGKAFGGYGAFVLATKELIDGLSSRLRTLIYSTALPPLVPAAMRAALAMVQSGELQPKLAANLAQFLAGSRDLPLLPSTTPIQPLLCGTSEAALAAASQLRAEGLFVPAIRPPTVPEGEARLRITLSAAHTQDQIDRLLAALHRLPR